MLSLSGNPDKTERISDERRSKRLLLTLLGAALLFFILGIGNVLVGMYKAHEYTTLLHKAQYEIEHDERPVIPLVDGALNINSQTKHIERLQYRLDYYNLVSHGGKIFLAIAGALLLCCVFVKNGEDTAEGEKVKT